MCNTISFLAFGMSDHDASVTKFLFGDATTKNVKNVKNTKTVESVLVYYGY